MGDFDLVSKILKDEESNTLLKHRYTPFAVLFILMLILHSFFIVYGDDIWFKALLDDKTLPAVIFERYQIWTSRTVIEIMLISLLQLNFWVWKILDCIIVMLLAFSLSKIINYNKNLLLDWGIVLFLLIYNFQEMFTAGWAATTLNYLWPFTFGAYTLSIIFKVIREEEVKKHEYVLASLSAIVSVNAEQLCALSIVTYTVISIYLFVTKKKYKFSLFLLAISLSSLLYIFINPGNKERAIVERRYMPDFGMLTFIDKVTLGFTSTMQYYLLEISLVFICLAIIMGLYVWKKYRDKTYRLIAILPFSLVVLFTITSDSFFVKLNEKLNMPIFLEIGKIFTFLDDKVFFNINDKMQNVTIAQPINVDNFYKISSYVPLLILIFALILLILNIYLIFENKVEALIVVGILLLGIGARMIMGFSPTVFASSTRTYIYSDFAFILTSILMLRKMIYENDLKYIKLIYIILGICAFLNYARLMFIFVVMY